MEFNEILCVLMFVSFIGLLFTGFPVAWVLGGLAVLFTAIAIVLEIDLGLATGVDWAYTSISVNRVWDVMKNWVLVALPLFIFMGLMLERAREMATLRALGLTRGQLWLVTQAQTGVLGLVAGLLSIPLGLALAVVLVYSINRRSFGWTMDFEVSPGALLPGFLLAVAAALLAGIAPALNSYRSSVADALRDA